MKVTYKNLVSATITVDNSSDSERAYAVSGNVQVNNGTANNVDSGVVSDLGGTNLATFNSYSGGSNLNINFLKADSETQAAILSAVNEFLASAKAAEYACSVEVESEETEEAKEEEE